MDRFGLRQNIAHFTKLLETETDTVVRRAVQRMLDDAEVELARLEAESSAPAGADAH